MSTKLRLLYAVSGGWLHHLVRFRSASRHSYFGHVGLTSTWLRTNGLLIVHVVSVLRMWTLGFSDASSIALSLWFLDLEKVQHWAFLGLSQHRRLRGTQSQGHAEWPYCILWEGGLHRRLKWPCVRFISRGTACRSDCRIL